MKQDKIKYITIHCSATPANRNVDAKIIDGWHRKRGFKKIGYHYVIRRDGFIEKGRMEDEVGAHVLKANKGNIGICLCGNGKWTQAQTRSFRELVDELKYRYPDAEVRPHNWFQSARRQRKSCPKFELNTVLRRELLPREEI